MGLCRHEGQREKAGGGTAGETGRWTGDIWNVGRLPEGSWEESIIAQTLGQVLNSIPVLIFKAAIGSGQPQACFPARHPHWVWFIGEDGYSE